MIQYYVDTRYHLMDTCTCMYQLYGNYRPQRSYGKVIFSQACVKNSVHRGEVSASVHAWIHPSPWADTPLDKHPPRQTPPCPGRAGVYPLVISPLKSGTQNVLYKRKK